MNLLVKSKLPPRSGSVVLSQLNPIHEKGPKSSQFILLPIHLIHSFFFPDLICTAIRRLNFLARVPITSAFFPGLDGSDITVLRTLRLKICFVENAEDMVGVVSEVDVAVLTCNSCGIVFFKRYSLTQAASFFSNTLYFFGSRYFLLSLSVFFLAALLALYRSPFFWR